MSWPPVVDDFKQMFARDFPFGIGPEAVMDADINRAFNEANAIFNQGLWANPTELSIAFLYIAAHYLVLNVQVAGGLSNSFGGKGLSSQGSGNVVSKSVGSVSISYSNPEAVAQNSILSSFLQTDYGQRYLALLMPRLVGNIAIVSGFNDVSGPCGFINVLGS